MLIPSIDLMGGRIVQLVQGEKLKLAFDDFEYWIERFSKYPLVQLIDLDAAMRQGENRALIEMICKRLPCQVGGGLKTAEDGKRLLEVGAKRVIYGSSLFGDEPSTSHPSPSGAMDGAPGTSGLHPTHRGETAMDGAPGLLGPNSHVSESRHGAPAAMDGAPGLLGQQAQVSGARHGAPSSLAKRRHKVIRLEFAEGLKRELGEEALCFSVDTKAGRVAVKGWKDSVDLTPEEAVTWLEDCCAAFLYTNVDTEGTMQGFPMDVAAILRACTAKQLIVAGGIKERAEVDALDAMGVDAVAGMAVYSGAMEA